MGHLPVHVTAIYLKFAGYEDSGDCHSFKTYYPAQCTSPYTGDGSLCVLDSDGDGYPDRALRTCSTDDQQIYCSADTCPFAPNPDQADTSPCVGDETSNFT